MWKFVLGIKKVGQISKFDDKGGRNAVKKEAVAGVGSWDECPMYFRRERKTRVEFAWRLSKSQKLEQPCIRIFCSLSRAKSRSAFFLLFPSRIFIAHHESLTPFFASRCGDSFIKLVRALVSALCAVQRRYAEHYGKIFQEFNRFAVDRPALFRIS